MTALQIQTFVPRDGNLSITLPERFREADVELFISKKEKSKSGKMSKEEYIVHMNSFVGTLQNVDYSDLREEPRLSEEEKDAYIARMNAFRGTLRDVDYSDLREETDREL